MRVAYHLGRDYCGIEASEDYLPIIEANVKRPLPQKKAKASKPKPPDKNQMALFG